MVLNLTLEYLKKKIVVLKLNLRQAKKLNINSILQMESEKKKSA